MNKKIIFLLIMGLVLVSFAYAEKSLVNTGISAKKDQIYSNESAIFVLDLFSESSQIQRYSIYTDIEWTLTTMPTSDKILKVMPHSTKSTNVLIRPKSEANILSGAYTVRIYLKNIDTDEIIKKDVIIHINGKGDNKRDYLPSLRAELSVDNQIDPRDPVNIKVYVDNQNPLLIEDLNLRVISGLFHIQDNFSIKGLGKKELFYTVKLNDTHPPATDYVKVMLNTFKNGKVYEFSTSPKNIEVVSYGQIDETKEIKKGFLTKKITYNLENHANVPKTYELKIKKGFFKSIFQTFDIDPIVKELDGDKYYTWQISLGVSKQTQINEKVNYQPIFVFILAIIILVGLYVLFRSPLLIKKSMIVVKEKHGGISEITVQLDVKNRSPQPHKNLEVKDKIPNVFELQKDFKIGTLHPSQILKHERKGTILKWNLDIIDPFEERIITYTLKSRLNIIGKFTLPSSSLRFKDNEKAKIIHSNKILMMHKK